MKILVIDRDTLSMQLLRSRLEGMGHTVVEETVKNEALERLEREEFEVVFFDPAPLNNARPVVLSIRRSVKNYPYIILMSHDMPVEEAMKSGANDIMTKPLAGQHMESIIDNAERLTALIRRIGDESEDYPSAGGVIAKSAFNQLFLSCIDRADRYAERSYLVFISIRNYRSILENEGVYAADYARAKLSQYLVRLRRQSDIIAQTDKAEYCLMLQRPQYETEPREAANRFAEALYKLEGICEGGSNYVEIEVSLIDIPVGTLHFHHIVSYDRKSAKNLS